MTRVCSAAPIRASQNTEITAFAKLFFCPKTPFGLVWDLFFRHLAYHEKADTYDAAFFLCCHSE